MDKKWIGEVCDICGKEFTENDEVAVCPECGAPYHRACIAEKGTCVHEQLHAAGKVWEGKQKASESRSEEGVTCSHCGKMNVKGGRFCTHCGAPMLPGTASARPNMGDSEDAFRQGQDGNPFGDPQFIQRIVMDPYGGMNPDETLEEDVTVREAATYVKKNPMYFMTRFRTMKQRIPGLNFSAFLFGGLYYIYRKVYGVGILLLLAQLLLSVPAFIVGIYYATDMVGITLPFGFDLNAVSNIDMLCSMLRMILMFISGFLFNRIYRGHVVGKVRKIKEKVKDSQKALLELSARGGVNFALIIVLLVAYFSVYYAVILSIVQVFGK